MAYAEARWPGSDETKLVAARALYVARCSGCHNAPALTDYRPSDWPKVMKDMAKEAKLVASQSEEILRYVFTILEGPQPTKGQ